MALTNKYNLPKSFVNAISSSSDGVAGTISVAQLIDAPQIRALKRKHKVEEDITDRIWMLFNSAMHFMLEKANIETVRERSMEITSELFKNKSVQEQEPKDKEALFKVANYIKNKQKEFFPEPDTSILYGQTITLSLPNDKVLYGQYDLYDSNEKTLYLYKMCSVHQYIFPESRDRWKVESNIIAAMMREQGIEVDAIRIIAIFKDWSASKIVTNKDYPERQCLEIPVTVAEHNKILSYIERRSDLHNKMEHGEYIECSGKERWATASQWAVMTPTQKRAIRAGFATEAMAGDYILEMKHKHPQAYIEERPGENKRCDSFCPVKDVCPQHKNNLRKLTEAAEKI